MYSCIYIFPPTLTLGFAIWFASSSVQFCRSAVSDSLQPRGVQHARPPCPSPTPRVYSNSCPLSWWCHLILCHPLLLLPSIFPSIRIFSKKLAPCISSVQSLSCVQLFATPWTAACQASLSITNSRSPPKPMSIESVIPSNNHLILCLPLLLLPSIFPSIKVFSNKSALHIRWPKYWSFSFSISPSHEYSGFPLELTCLIFLQSKGLSRIFSNTTVQKHPFFGQLSL